MNQQLKKIGMAYTEGAGWTGEPLFSDISSYYARHSWASIAAEVDVPMDVIGQALGHSTPYTTTDIYVNRRLRKIDEANRCVIDYLSKTKRDTVGYKNPGDVTTGEYEDTCDVDERFWAYAELFKTTGEKTYEDAMLKELPSNGYTLGWQGVAGYGAYAYLSSKGATSTSNIKTEAKKKADEIVDNSNKYGYGSSIIGSYPWGSNLSIANNGEYLLMMKTILGDNKETVDKQLNYLFGNNATGYCFLTGFGTLSPEHPHHRPSQATGKTVPGMIVGGPNSGLDDPYVQNVLKDTPSAKCYADNSQSYSTNEITIYWNSPVIYLLAGEIAEEKN